jgi:hypothetical protein
MKYFRLIFIGFCFFIGSASIVLSAEKKAQLIFSEMTVKPDQKIQIPVLLNNVPNMAGIKLALKFDKDLLSYVKSEKTKTTASLMHIVNDKHPGKLVIVMAGARGVPVNTQSIMNLYFKVNNNIPKPVDTKFTVTELQLMSDSLKELEYEYKIFPIHIQASKHIKKKSDKKIDIIKQTKTSETNDLTPKVQTEKSAETSKVTPKKTNKKISRNEYSETQFTSADRYVRS